MLDKTNLSLATAGGAMGHVNSFKSASVRKPCFFLCFHYATVREPWIFLCYAVHITYFFAAASNSLQSKHSMMEFSLRIHVEDETQISVDVGPNPSVISMWRHRW